MTVCTDFLGKGQNCTELYGYNVTRLYFTHLLLCPESRAHKYEQLITSLKGIKTCWSVIWSLPGNLCTDIQSSLFILMSFFRGFPGLVAQVTASCIAQRGERCKELKGVRGGWEMRGKTGKTKTMCDSNVVLISWRYNFVIFQAKQSTWLTGGAYLTHIVTK